MKRRIAEEVLCFFCIILFVYTGLSKLSDTNTFTAQIEQTWMLKPFGGFLAVALPVVEIIVALMLAFNKTRLWGLYAFSVIMTAFTIYILIILNFSEKIPCSCGGIISTLGWRPHLILNTSFIAFSLIAIWLHRKGRIQDTSNLIAAA